MLIETVFGHETFLDPSVNCRVSVFFKRNAKDDETPLGRVRRTDDFNLLSTDTIQAREGSRHHGFWSIQRWNVPEGSFLKVFIQRKPVSSIIEQRAMAYLRLRNEAALRRLRLDFTDHPLAALSHAHVEGRFDIIPAEDFDKWGLDVRDKWLHYFDREDAWVSMIEEQVLEREVVPLRRPKVQEIETESGTKRVIKKGRKRLLNLRK